MLQCLGSSKLKKKNAQPPLRKKDLKKDEITSSSSVLLTNGMEPAASVGAPMTGPDHSIDECCSPCKLSLDNSKCTQTCIEYIHLTETNESKLTTTPVLALRTCKRGLNGIGWAVSSNDFGSTHKTHKSKFRRKRKQLHH